MQEEIASIIKTWVNENYHPFLGTQPLLDDIEKQDFNCFLQSIKSEEDDTYKLSIIKKEPDVLTDIGVLERDYLLNPGLVLEEKPDTKVIFDAAKHIYKKTYRGVGNRLIINEANIEDIKVPGLGQFAIAFRSWVPKNTIVVTYKGANEFDAGAVWSPVFDGFLQKTEKMKFSKNDDPDNYVVHIKYN